MFLRLFFSFLSYFVLFVSLPVVFLLIMLVLFQVWFDFLFFSFLFCFSNIFNFEDFSDIRFSFLFHSRLQYERFCCIVLVWPVSLFVSFHHSVCRLYDLMFFNFCLSLELKGLKLNLFIESSEYLGFLSHSAGARILIHSQGEMPYPDDEGINLAPGISTSIGLRRVWYINSKKRSAHTLVTTSYFFCHM